MAKSEPKIIKRIENLEKKEEGKIKKLIKNPRFQLIFLGVIVILVIVLIVYFYNAQGQVYIENSQITAPVISLTSVTPGILDRVFVKPGDVVSDNMVVAQVSGVPIKTAIGGIIVSTQDTPGQVVSAQTPVVQMIDPAALRVVGRVEEDKGFKDIKLGQRVVFTVDAFPGKNYEGIVDEISPQATQHDIVFSISNARAENQFNVYVRFDLDKYPELGKNELSAKMWVYK